MDFRIPLTARELHQTLVDRGLIPDGVHVRTICIYADRLTDQVTMTVDCLPDDRLTEAL